MRCLMRRNARSVVLTVVAVTVAVGTALALTFLVIDKHGSNGLRSEGSHQAAHPAPVGIRRGHQPGISHPKRAARAVARSCPSAEWKPSTSASYAAIVRRAGVVWQRRGTGPAIERFGRIDQDNYPTVFAVVGAVGNSCRPRWLRVQVSAPPNGRTGWVRSWLVQTYSVNTRIVVHVSQRRLLLYRDGKQVLSTQVAVGTTQTPTPVGNFFVNERFLLANASGPFGVAALGLSAHSTVLHDWVQGGPIAIHGTDEPASIGQAASHGCIRLNNTAMRRLFNLTPAGTPVLIRQ
jgi:lipoprotein-anchoring transpeptidase ErfK/SrfK